MSDPNNQQVILNMTLKKTYNLINRKVRVFLQNIKNNLMKLNCEKGREEHVHMFAKFTMLLNADKNRLHSDGEDQR